LGWIFLEMTADAKILSELRSAGTGGVALATLSTRTGENSKTLARRIADLQPLGY
jgi:lambda repressor-like predicted transcriptional regulator